MRLSVEKSLLFPFNVFQKWQFRRKGDVVTKGGYCSHTIIDLIFEDSEEMFLVQNNERKHGLG